MSGIGDGRGAVFYRCSSLKLVYSTHILGSFAKTAGTFVL